MNTSSILKLAERMSNAVDASEQAMASAPDVWIIKPSICSKGYSEVQYPEFKDVRKRLIKEWFPKGCECFQKYVKEGDIMEYFVIFFDAEEGGLGNKDARRFAKICGVSSTGNFVAMRKKWIDGEEVTIDMGVDMTQFLRFCEGSELSLDESIKLSGASAPPQKIDCFSKDSLEGKNKEKSLSNMSSISENKKSNMYASVCNPPCVPRSMMGTSWWKCLGYPSACGCAEVARFENKPAMPNAYPKFPTRAETGDRMDISIVKSRNVICVFPARYVDDSAEKSCREKYMNYWFEFCKEQGIDAEGGTMEIFHSADDIINLYPSGLKNVVIAPILSEVVKHIGNEDCPKFSVTCGHMALNSEVKGDSNLGDYLNSDGLRDAVFGLAKMDIEEKWIEFSKHRLRGLKMSFADSDSPAVPPEKQCVFCGCDWGEYGNSSEPVSSGQCCDDCNRNVVLKFRRESRKEKPESKCSRDCDFINGCDCEAKNAEATRNNKIVDIIGEQVLSACVKISGVVDMDAGVEVGTINKCITPAEVKLVGDAVKADKWVDSAVAWVKSKGKVTIAEAVQGLDSFILGLGYRSEVKQVYYRISERIKAEDTENARLQAIAEAELLKVMAEAKPEKKGKPKTAKQLEAEATRQANAEKKKADKAKAEYEAKSAIAQEANRKKAQDKQKAILKAKRANQMKLAEQYQGERKF